MAILKDTSTSFLPLSWYSKNSIHILSCHFQVKIALLTLLSSTFFISLPLTMALHVNEYPFCCHDMCMHVCACVYVYMCTGMDVCECTAVLCVYVYTHAMCVPVYIQVYVCVCLHFCILLPVSSWVPLLTLLVLSSSFLRNVFLKHLVKDSLTGPNILNMLKADFVLSPSLSLANLLDCIPKARIEGLFLYLTTMSFLRLNTKV